MLILGYVRLSKGKKKKINIPPILFVEKIRGNNNK